MMRMLPELFAVIEEKMKAGKAYPTENKEKQKELDRISRREQELRLKATEGSVEARESTRNKIYFLLSEMGAEINAKTVDGIIRQYHIDYFKNIYTGNAEDNLKKPIDCEIEEYFQRYSINQYDSFDKKLWKLSQIIYQELYGFSILDELIFESELNEVACTRHDYIWIQFKGIKRRIPNARFKFSSEDFYKKVIENRMASTAAEEMNAGNPIIYCTLGNGTRVTALRPPLSRNFVVNARIFNYKNLSDELRNRFMAEKMLELLKMLAGKGRRNIAIIGEMGSGKTTAADELVIKPMDDDLALGLAENVHELNISRKYQEKNVIELQYVNGYKPTDIMEMFFRLNRDVVVLGEVRSCMEAFEMINAMLRQARGSLFTFHSSSIRRMVHDLRKLLMQTGFYTDYKEARFDVADAIDLAIHIKLDRNTGVRYVYKLSEIIANEEDMNYKIRDLFAYDRQKAKYLLNKEGPSKSTISSCLEFEMTREDADYLSSLFDINDHEKDMFEYMGEDHANT